MCTAGAGAAFGPDDPAQPAPESSTSTATPGVSQPRPILALCPAYLHKFRTAWDINGAATHNDAVTAIAWSLVGLMAASLGVLAAALFAGIGDLGGRIDGMGSRLDARIDALGSELRAELRDQRNETHLLVDAIHRLDQRLTRAGG